MEKVIETITDLNNAIAAEPDQIDIIEVQRVTKLLVEVARRQPGNVVKALVDEVADNN